MEYYKYARSYTHSYKVAAQRSIMLDAKMAELHQTKQDIKQAKDDAMQTWLDSRPLIDELEKLQTGLESKKSGYSVNEELVFELESQLESIHKSIKTKKEDEIKIRETIEEITSASERMHQEMEQFKLETDEEKQRRSKLKEVLRLRKQTLRTLQLTIRAVRLETEANGASTAEALHNINRSQMENTVVHLPEDNYRSLARRANEETSLAEWRVSVSTEQKFAAQETRDLAFRRLTDANFRKGSRKMKIESEITEGSCEREEDDQQIMADQIGGRQTEHSPRTRGIEETHQRYPKQVRSARNNKRKKIVKKKKPSIFAQIRTFLVQKITKLFG